MFKLSWAMLKMESYGHKFALLFPLTVVLCALCLQDASAASGPPGPSPGELVTAQLLLIIIIISIGADCSSS